jgi:hypothetical protein
MPAPLLRGGISRHARKTISATRSRPVLCGVTVDSVDNLSGILASIAALPVKPTVRVVFDQGQPASAYTSAVAAIHEVAFVMGELLDSDYEGGADGNPPTTTAQYSTLTSSYLATLGRNVDIWEIGNEVNGNWTEIGTETGWDGSYSLVIAKLAEAYNLVSAAGYQTALTLYANYGGEDGASELSPEAFSAQVPAYIRNGLDYVLLSYYEEDNGFLRPTAAQWGAHFAALRALYPNAWQGFGEIGTDTAVADGGSAPNAESICTYYYGLAPTVGGTLLPYYCGGYFYWNWWEDCIPHTSTMFPFVANGMTAEVAALG